MSHKKDHFNGFTLLEAIFALFIICGICLLFSTMIQQADRMIQRLDSREEKEWQIFLIQMNQEVMPYQFQMISDNKLIFLDPTDNHVVTIEQSSQVIRKNDRHGYQPLLTEVKSVSFTRVKEQVVISVTFRNGIQKEGRWLIHQETTEKNAGRDTAVCITFAESI